MKSMRILQGMMMNFLAVLALPAAGASPADPLFDDHSSLKVEITAPLSTLVRDRSDTEELPGSFSYEDAEGARINLEIQLSARGNFRHRNCDFPPMTLNFRRSQVVGTLFDQQNKLKMVNHCKITRRYEQSVLREYLAYRFLNTVTDLSFKVRLLQVTWVDSEERRPRMVRNAFVIEHRNRLTARTGLEQAEIEFADIGDIRPDHLNLTSLFQYLIGNFDFSPLAGSGGECCHNYEMFSSSSDPLVAIPFDFDFSGIVNAPNAVPNLEQGVERIGQRVYHGYCVNNGHVQASIARFTEARSTLYNLVAALEELEPSVRDNIALYMDGFYEVIEDPGQVEQKITGNCN